MATPVEILVRNIFAAAYAPTEDGNATYLLNERNGKLVRERWTETTEEAQEILAEDVKAKSTAIYLVWDNHVGGNNTNRQEIIFFINSSNSLTAIKLDRTNSSWVKMDLGSTLDLAIGQPEQLSGFATPDGALILYKNNDGTFQGLLISSDGSLLKSVSDFPTDSLPGSPYHILPGDNQLHLFYVDDSNCVRYTTLDYAKQVWEERDLGDAEFPNEITKLTALPEEKGDGFTIFVVSDSQIETVDATGRTNLGTVYDGKFDAESSRCYGRPNINIHIHGNSGNIIIGRIPGWW